MTDVNRWLKEHDPLREEPELPEADANALRRSILRAIDRPAAVQPSWGRRLALVSGAAAIAVAAVLVGRWPGEPPPPAPAVVDAALPRLAHLRFSTPGGTRIVWTFNPDLNLSANPAAATPPNAVIRP